MRLVSGPKLALLNSGRLNFSATAKVEDGDGTMRDLTNIVGVDFFDGATWTENIDQPVASGTITLRREAKKADGTHVSIAPAMTTSPANRKVDTTYAPLVAAGRKVQILVAWTAAGVAPVAGDYLLLFDGKIDTVNWKGLDSVVTVDVRDKGAWLQDTFIEQLRDYGTPAGVPVETVMQAILNDNQNTKLGLPVLYVPVSPGWMIHQFKQDQKSVLDALRDLAQQIGWDVRYLWRESTAQFELTFYQPPRGKVVADWTIGPDLYVDVTDLKQSDANVRNRVRARATAVSTGVPLVSLAVDATSIAKYGERYIEVVEEVTSNIDSQAELDAFTAAMLSDLKDPLADQEIENLLWPLAQLGDLGTWTHNGKHYDTDQNFAVIQIKHDFTREKRRTFIQSRGKVAGQFNKWLGFGGGGASGVPVPPNPLIGPVLMENTARDGNGEGAMHIPIVFEKNTSQVLIYSTEAPAGVDPPPAPDLVENRLAANVLRHEGAIASSEQWWTEVTISTTSGWQRRIIALPVGPTGLRGNPFVDIHTCVDTGTPPAAPPSAFTVTMSIVGGVPQAALAWTNGDAAAQTRVWRNGIILVPRVAAGVHALIDIGLSPDVQYNYRVQHIRNGQTSEFADVGDATSWSPVLAAPTWDVGYPRGGGYDSTLLIPPPNGLVLIQVINPDALAYTEIHMNDQDTLGGTYSIVATLLPGETGTTLNAGGIPTAVTNHPRWFYLVSIRPGYTMSAASAIQSANFGP